jgi:hypothetical protein
MKTKTGRTGLQLSLALGLLGILAGAAPLGYSVSGCSSGCVNAELGATATTFTLGFAPYWITVANDDDEDSVFVDVTGAAAANNASTTTSVEVRAGERAAWGFPTDNGPGTVSMVCAAAKTCAYRLGAGR